MTLVPAKCPECGGNVVVDSEKDAWTCDFCKTPFIVDKAIQTFNTTYNTTNVSNVTNNNDIKAEVVNVYDSKDNDFVIKAGELIEYNGSSMDVVIPNEVVSINKDCFKKMKIRSLAIHEGVREIGCYDGCDHLEEVKLPSVVDHGSVVSFSGCRKLRHICIPEGVLAIRDSAFANCISLESIVLPKGLQRIGSGAFKNCSLLKSIRIPSSVKSIQREAFDFCENLNEVIIDNKDKIDIDLNSFNNGVPNKGGDDVKAVFDRMRKDEVRRREREEAEKEQQLEEERKRLEESERKERELGIEVFEKRINAYVRRDMGDRKKCPICEFYTLNFRGKCTKKNCDCYGMKPIEYANRASKRIKEGKCPSCGAQLKRFTVSRYGDVVDLSIMCSNTSLTCRLWMLRDCL